MPKSAHFSNNKSAITHSDFFSEAIQNLLKRVNPLSVTVQKSGKKRLILDLRYVNTVNICYKTIYENQKTQYKLIKNPKTNRYKRTNEQLYSKPL